MKIKTIRGYDNCAKWEERVNIASTQLKAKYMQTHVFSHNEGVFYVAVLFYEGQ